MQFQILRKVILVADLCHYGVKGMKWGIRRYQNKDGTLTAAGKKRYDRDVRENNAKKKENRIIIEKSGDPKRWVREDLSRSKKAVDTGLNLVKTARNVSDKAGKSTKKMDLSSMTDNELRQAITRAQLETQYNSLFGGNNTNKVNNGKSYVKDILDVTETALTVGSTALGLALAIKELRG